MYLSIREGALTPPASEHIMSVAFPQQWSESPGHAQDLTHPISLTRPGNLATIFFAPSTATLLQDPTAGIFGALYPPNPVAVDEQHLKELGPGHWLATVVPAQSLAKRQLPAVPHGDLVQHLTLAASAGHAPDMVFPPLAEHAAVVTQTPVEKVSNDSALGAQYAHQQHRRNRSMAHWWQQKQSRRRRRGERR
jgi:hypothetical protein